MIGPTGCGKTEIARRLAGARRRRSSRSRRPSIPRSAISAGTWRASSAICSNRHRDDARGAARRSRPRPSWPPRSAARRAGRRGLRGRHANEVPSDAARGRARAARDRGRGPASRRRHADRPVRHPGHAGAGGHGQSRRDDGKACSAAAPQAAKHDGRGSPPALGAEESDKLLDKERVRAGAIAPSSRTASSSSTRSTRSAPATEGGRRRRCPPRGRAAGPPAADRGDEVTTKYGPVKTDHILFIASGAFHLTKPSDLLPELQGRLPIRVELQPR